MPPDEGADGHRVRRRGEPQREGDREGTFEFQQEFLRFHLDVIGTKPWLSGAIYWTLREFLVRPGWDGGNPIPQPPMHQKAVLSYDGSPKPAYYDPRAAFRATQQYPAP